MMLARLIQFALSQRLLMLLAVLLLCGFGAFAAKNLPIDAFPDISPTQVKIIIKAPGMTPEEVESRITALVEIEMLGIPKQTLLRSVAKYALTDITLNFEDGTDIYWARQQVSERLNGIWANLPSGISGGLAPLSTPLSEMLMFTIEGDELSLSERRHLLDWVVRPALRTVPGVADVNALGGMVRTFEVVPKADALAALGITIDDLAAALEKNNRNDGAGRVNVGAESMLVRIEGQLATIDDINNTVITQRGGTPISVATVADVHMGALTRYGVVSQNGKGEAVEGLVVGLRGANARVVVDGVKHKLAELQKTLPNNARVEIFYDRSGLVERAVHTVSKALIEAIVLVLILLGLFLGDVRAAISVALILPLSALITFIAMRLFGLSANLMSLGGLAIAIGMLVDAAVVVVENIASQLGNGNKNLPRLHIVYRAAREVALPMTTGILIIVIVFLPLLSLEGLEGKMFAPVALTIVFALLGSLLMSLTAIPVIAAALLRTHDDHEPWLPRKLAAIYRPLLTKALAFPKQATIFSLALLLSTAIVFGFIGKTFMPTMDEGDLIVQLEKLPSINLSESRDLDLQVQRILLERVPEIARIVARAGSDELGLDPMGLNETDMFVVLKPGEQWTVRSKDEVIAKIRTVMDDIKGINFGFTQPIDMRISEMLTGSRGDVAIKIFGSDLTVLGKKAEEIAGVLRGINGSVDVFYSLNSGVQYLAIKVRRERAGQFGLSIEQFEDLLRAQIEGRQHGVIIEKNARIPLLVRYRQIDGSSIDDFKTQLIALPNGNAVPLEALADIERVEGPVSIFREQGNRYVVVRSNVEGRDLVGFVQEAQTAVAKHVELPAGYLLNWSGQFENQQRASARLMLVVPVALLLVFLLLFSMFGALRQVLLILSTIPFAMVGGVYALWIAREFLSVPASVGFIALLGIAVLNGVVMVSYFDQLRARGMPIAEVVVNGALRRLRPVMMTASIAAFGLIPLLFATGPGSEIQRPLAVVVIGGLVSSTALTLFLLPILYRRFMNKNV